MESRPDTSSMGSEDNLRMIPFDQGELGQNPDDVMARRLKNRERQRRYRARKRLQADVNNVETTNNSSPPQTQVQLNFSFSCDENRILCKRNWKQDARTAHEAKQQQVVENGTRVKCENNLASSVKEHYTERKVVLGRRHWKSDARNKKS